jgi:hypothetical protein
MSDRPPERWVLVIDVPNAGAPASATMKRLLKHIGRRWGLRCRGFSEDRQKFELIMQIERLKKIIDGLAARVAAQSELLARRSEKKAG